MKRGRKAIISKRIETIADVLTTREDWTRRAYSQREVLELCKQMEQQQTG